MNGAHDLGGMMGFGPVIAEVDEPAFHHAWERRAFALTLAMARPGRWTIDQSRFARESLPPAVYLASSYYRIWLAGLERLLAERGFVAPEEISAGRLSPSATRRQVETILTADAVVATLARGGPTSRPATSPALFAVDDLVRARTINPLGHTRLPRYARGRLGRVTHRHGMHVFPDASGAGKGEQPQQLYTVSFTARELWGDDADPDVSTSLDLWESYLERP